MDTIYDYGGQPVGDAYMKFADMDNDGDMDVFVENFYDELGYYGSRLKYYENTAGPAATPVYVKRTQYTMDSVSLPILVDLDNDGDLDLFHGTQYLAHRQIGYIENTGSASNMVLTPVPYANLPFLNLDLNFGFSSRLWTSNFYDFDNDGDLDLRLSHEFSNSYVSFNENIGSATAPDFAVFDTMGTNIFFKPYGSFNLSYVKYNKFIDLDQDGDDDWLANGIVYENIGSNANPIWADVTDVPSKPEFQFFTSTSTHPTFTNEPEKIYYIADIDSDGDLDIYSDLGDWAENMTITSTQKVEEENILKVYPNPTADRVYFDQPLTGQLRLLDLSGRVLLDQSVEQIQEMNLRTEISELKSGMYFLHCAPLGEPAQVIKVRIMD